jgi:hypothetical protein
VIFSSSYFYAGLPRTWWQYAVRFGLLGESDLVERYGTPPSVASVYERETPIPGLVLEDN